MKLIYLDYAATTPVDASVAQEMARCLTAEGLFGNPASLHLLGRQALEMVELARVQVADLIQADPSEVIWTSGATEANNLALKGAAKMYQRRGKHIITLKTEHKAVLDTCQQLEKEGFEVTYLTPDANGLVDLDALEKALRPETILVSIMHVNNETGVIQPLEAISKMTSAKGILLHVDAAQSAGKVEIALNHLPIDLLSLSAHKIYGPKGIGALYLRKKPRVRLAPLLHGGGHEQGMRSGTLATHQIVGMGAAFALARTQLQLDVHYITHLREVLLTYLQKIPCMQLNVDLAHTIPHILNVRFEGMIADAILARLPHVATSTASACQGKGTEGSYVLRALGFTQQQVKSSIRFSFGRLTTIEDMHIVGQSLQQLFSIN